MAAREGRSEPGQPVVDDVTQARLARLRELIARADYRLVDGAQSPEIEGSGGDDDVRAHAVQGGAERVELDSAVADGGQDGSDVRILREDLVTPSRRQIVSSSVSCAIGIRAG